ncbi:MAG TPA: hypothetical protein VM933_09455, partial [Acidimicrobiales bacterium]|nr:hypothetical protein [Acidimicrobiales bacterium]
MLAVGAVLALIAAGPAGGVAVPPATTPFSGYATGTALHVNALQVAGVGPLIENTALAFSGASVASQGQAAAIT